MLKRTPPPWWNEHLELNTLINDSTIMSWWPTGLHTSSPSYSLVMSPPEGLRETRVLSVLKYVRHTKTWICEECYAHDGLSTRTKVRRKGLQHLHLFIASVCFALFFLFSCWRGSWSWRNCAPRTGCCVLCLNGLGCQLSLTLRAVVVHLVSELLTGKLKLQHLMSQWSDVKHFAARVSRISFIALVAVYISGKSDTTPLQQSLCGSDRLWLPVWDPVTANIHDCTSQLFGHTLFVTRSFCEKAALLLKNVWEQHGSRENIWFFT